LNYYQTTIGNFNIISGGVQNYAIGAYNRVSGTQSMSLGTYSEALAPVSFTLGHYLTSENIAAFVIGLGKSPEEKLTNTIESSLMIGFNSQYPTLFISETGADNESGRVGIGNVTDPQAKLHIRADEDEDASLLLEAVDPDKEINIRLGQTHKISATEAGNLNFETADNKHFVFHQGDIFLEDIQSGIILKSPNGQCWRGTLTDQGTLNFAQTTCPEGTSTAAQSQNSEKLMLVYPNPASYRLTVETRLSGRQGTLAVLSTAGFRLSEQPVNTGKTIVQLEAYAAGTYILQLEIDGKVVESTKFVKK